MENEFLVHLFLCFVVCCRVTPNRPKSRQLLTGRVAVLFGNERNGLTNDDLRLAQVCVYIPTQTINAEPSPTSLNLSHTQGSCFECYGFPTLPFYDQTLCPPPDFPHHNFFSSAHYPGPKAFLEIHFVPSARPLPRDWPAWPTWPSDRRQSCSGILRKF